MSTYSRSHTSTAKAFTWELFGYPPYSPDLIPSYYCLYTHLKNWFNNNEEEFKTLLMLQVTNFFPQAYYTYYEHTVLHVSQSR
jgi:transposase